MRYILTLFMVIGFTAYSNAQQVLHFPIPDCADVSIEEQLIIEQSLNLYPNPAEDKLFVSFKGVNKAMELNYRIISLTGQLLKEGSLNTAKGQKETEINISELTSGIYIFTIEFSEGNIRRHFIVQ
jgi:hypothetical protein